MIQINIMPRQMGKTTLALQIFKEKQKDFLSEINFLIVWNRDFVNKKFINSDNDTSNIISHNRFDFLVRTTYNIVIDTLIVDDFYQMNKTDRTTIYNMYKNKKIRNIIIFSTLTELYNEEQVNLVRTIKEMINETPQYKNFLDQNFYNEHIDLFNDFFTEPEATIYNTQKIFLNNQDFEELGIPYGVSNENDYIDRELIGRIFKYK